MISNLANFIVYSLSFATMSVIRTFLFIFLFFLLYILLWWHEFSYMVQPSSRSKDIHRDKSKLYYVSLTFTFNFQLDFLHLKNLVSLALSYGIYLYLYLLSFRFNCENFMFIKFNCNRYHLHRIVNRFIDIAFPLKCFFPRTEADT